MIKPRTLRHTAPTLPQTTNQAGNQPVFKANSTYKGKGKIHPRTCHVDTRGCRGKLYSFFNLGGRWGGGGRLTPCPGRFTPDFPVLTVQEARWPPGPVWTGAENLAPTSIRSQDRPARNQSLYLLRNPGPPSNAYTDIILHDNSHQSSLSFA